jgi:excisionase family DNA binding protein
MRDESRPADRSAFTVGEAAKAAGVSRQTVYDWIARGHLWPLLTDDGYRIDADELARLLAARRAAGAAGVSLGTVLRWAADATAEV